MPKYLFVGISDFKYLEKHLQIVGIELSDCTLETVPPSSNHEDYDIVILLSKESLKLVKDTERIEAHRGSMYELDGTRYLCTLDPSMVRLNPWYLPAVLFDLKRAKNEVETKLALPVDTVVVTKDPKTVDEYFTEVSKSGEICSFDIETTMQGGEHIRCIGFSYKEDEALVVDTTQLDASDYIEMIGVLSKWMTGSNIRWCGQNIYGFDINYIERVWGFRVTNFVLDTMVAHHLLNPEFPHDLGTLTSFYTRYPYYKDTSEKDLHRYNGLDAICTWIAAQKMKSELERRNLVNVYFSYYHKLLTPLMEMAARGIKVDKLYQKELKNDLKKEIEEAQEELDRIYASYTRTDYLRLRLLRLTLLDKAGRKSTKWKSKRRLIKSAISATKKKIIKLESLNVRSPKELANFLYSTLNLKRIRGSSSTDETTINKLFIESGHPFLKTIIKLRKLRKSMSDYGEMKTDTDDRVRTTYAFCESGRLRSGKYESK